MMSYVTLDEHTIQTGSLELCHKISDIQLQQSGTGCGLSCLPNAGHVSLHDGKNCHIGVS